MMSRSCRQSGANHASPAEADPVAAETATAIPRLSIVHLMLWALCTALYLAWRRLLGSLVQFPEVDIPALPTGQLIVNYASAALRAGAWGAVLTGALVLMRRRLRVGSPLAFQPGHWLLIGYALLTVTHMPLDLFATLSLPSELASGKGVAIPNGINDSQLFRVFSRSVPLVVSLAVYGLAFRRNVSPWWKTVFGALAVAGVLQPIIFHLGLYFILPLQLPQWLHSVMLPIGIIAVCLWETALGRRRDWLHWSGVAAYVAIPAAAALQWFGWLAFGN